jgi:hypothetical protein
LRTSKPADEQARKKREESARVDEEVEDSFPASDAPSYAGGSHAIGGPRRPKRQDHKT